MTMALPLALDLDLLRSFVTIAEELSFTRAADRVGRTQSAISLQMQRLEGVLGRPVLQRAKGGSVELTAFGNSLLPQAREILQMNDSIMHSLEVAPMSGIVRLGVPDELTARYLPRILENFTHVAPSVEVHVVTAGSCVLAPQLVNNSLDLVLLAESQEPRQWPAEVVWRSKLQWVTSDIHKQHLHDPLPLTVSQKFCPFRPAWLNECLWRGMATRALERSNRKYQIVATSGTTSGQMAAAEAGLAVACALETEHLGKGMRFANPADGLPELPQISYLMCKASTPQQPLTDLLAAQIHDVFDTASV